MTRDEAAELSTHYTGGLVLCESCNLEPFDAFMATDPHDGYDDAAFAQWLLVQGWQFECHEYDHEGGPGSGKYPFMYYKPSIATSLSWSWTWVCPACRRSGVA